MKSAGLSLGADLGGTWLRLCLVRGPRQVIARARLLAPALPDIPAAMKAQLKKWRLRRVDRLTLGGKGLWRRPEQLALAARLKPLSRRVVVLSDLDLAHAAAFGGGPGVLVIAGTGSAALARDARGRCRRAGGLGPVLGDEGSAFWLGREALKEAGLRRVWPQGLAMRLAHDPHCVRKTAALATKVLALSARQASAKALRRRAAAALAALTREAVQGLSSAAPWPVCAHGGMFGDQGLRRDYQSLLPASRFRLQPPMMSAEMAAATLTL